MPHARTFDPPPSPPKERLLNFFGSYSSTPLATHKSPLSGEVSLKCVRNTIIVDPPNCYASNNTIPNVMKLYD